MKIFEWLFGRGNNVDKNVRTELSELLECLKKAENEGDNIRALLLKRDIERIRK